MPPSGDYLKADAVLQQMGYKSTRATEDGVFYRRPGDPPTCEIYLDPAPDATMPDIVASLYLQGLEMNVFFEILASL